MVIWTIAQISISKSSTNIDGGYMDIIFFCGPWICWCKCWYHIGSLTSPTIQTKPIYVYICMGLLYTKNELEKAIEDNTSFDFLFEQARNYIFFYSSMFLFEVKGLRSTYISELSWKTTNLVWLLNKCSLFVI